MIKPLRFITTFFLVMFLPGIALAQIPPTIICEQQVAIFNQLVEQVSQSRRNAEIEIAALRIKLQMLNDQLEAAKSTAPVGAPGAGVGMLRWEAGTTAGTLKLVAYSGTSTTGVVIVDNVGAGN